jgi:hypothetical protein
MNSFFYKSLFIAIVFTVNSNFISEAQARDFRIETQAGPADLCCENAPEKIHKSNQRLTYDQLFPLSIKSCAVSPYRDINHKYVNGLNFWGHSVLFLKGVCRDRSSPLPKVQLCDKPIDLNDPNSGSLISVVRSFSNTAWVAIEGGRFAFHGDLEPRDRIDEEVLRFTSRKAAEEGIFNNIQLSEVGEARQSAEGVPEGVFMESATVGTDYAIDFSRTSYCHVFPVTLDQMRDAVEYLNNLNEPYVTGREPFHWSLYENNCQHTVNNTLASIGLKKPIPIVKNSLPIGIFNVRPPGGGFIQYAKETLRSFEHFGVEEAFLDPGVRKSFETYGRPPIVHGTMVEVIPMHTENNRFFTSIPRLFSSPLSPKFNRFEKLLSDPRLRNLETNLEMFKEAYDHLGTSLLPLERVLEKNHNLQVPEFKTFYVIYKDWLNNAIQDVERKMRQLNS